MWDEEAFWLRHDLKMDRMFTRVFGQDEAREPPVTRWPKHVPAEPSTDRLFGPVRETL